MYYGSHNCHECVDELWAYINQPLLVDRGYRTIVVLNGDGYVQMRQQARDIHERFGDSVTVVYDKLPGQKRSAIRRKKITEFPCLLILSHGHIEKYYSYKQLFGTRPQFRILNKRFSL